MRPERQRDRPVERAVAGFYGSSTLQQKPRAVVIEPHPAVRAVLEHLLVREGYSVEVWEETPSAPPPPGPALLLVGAEDGSGLCVFGTLDAAKTLAAPPRRAARLLQGEVPGPVGIRAVVPKPFGVADVLRIVRAVNGFDGRKRNRSPDGVGEA